MDETLRVRENLRLVVTEEDLPPGLRTLVQAQGRGAVVLGGDDNHGRAFWDGVAYSVLRRVRAIAAEGFVVKDVELKFELDGKVFGVGVAGDVTVTFEPKS